MQNQTETKMSKRISEKAVNFSLCLPSATKNIEDEQHQTHSTPFANISLKLHIEVMTI